MDKRPAAKPARALGCAGGLAILAALGCDAPWILPGEGRGAHQFMLGEEQGHYIRRITVWLEPGHSLAWDLVRAPQEERRTLPLHDLDYGSVPGAMDQVFPKGVLEPLRKGQVITVELAYGPEPDVDPVVPSLVTQWFRREASGFAAVTEREALDAEAPKEAEEGSPKR